MPIFRSLMSSLGLAKRSNPLENPAVSLASPSAWAWLSQSDPTAAGKIINDRTALAIVSVYACVHIIAESVASLPLRLYSLGENGKVEAYDHPLHPLLTIAPNPEMTAFTFFESFIGSLALTGNAYAQIERAKNGNVIALWPLDPRKTNPYRMADGSLVYKTSDGMGNGAERTILSADILHVPLFSFDGLRGLSPIQQARQSLGLSLAAEKFGARFFGNGSRAGGVLSTSSDLDEKTVAQVRESWMSSQGGTNQGKTAVLPGDWKYQQIGLSPEESQFLATRSFQRTEIAALFRLDPHMIGDTTRMSNANHEQQSLQFVTDTLRPYMTRVEAEIMRKLFSRHGNATRYIVAFDVAERLRGDFATTSAGWQLGVLSGWLSRADVRSELGLNPGPDSLNIFMVPVNEMSSDRLAEPAPAPDAAAPTSAERNMLGAYRTAYLRLFRDAVGRISHRDADKRDLQAITQAFSPLYESLADLNMDQVRSSMNLTGFDPDHSKIIGDSLLKVTERAKQWTPENVDENASGELTRAVRAMTYQIHRAGAEHLAKTSIEEPEHE